MSIHTFFTWEAIMQTLKPALYVSAQIRPEDLPALKAQSIAQIICHRPDSEDATQPAFADIAAAADALGIRTGSSVRKRSRKPAPHWQTARRR